MCADIGREGLFAHLSGELGQILHSLRKSRSARETRERAQLLADRRLDTLQDDVAGVQQKPRRKVVPCLETMTRYTGPAMKDPLPIIRVLSLGTEP